MQWRAARRLPSGNLVNSAHFPEVARIVTLRARGTLEILYVLYRPSVAGRDILGVGDASCKLKTLLTLRSHTQSSPQRSAARAANQAMMTECDGCGWRI